VNALDLGAVVFLIPVWVIVVLLEALAMVQLQWDQPLLALRDSAVANVASITVLWLLSGVLFGFGSILIVLLVALVLSILIEGGTLQLLRRRPGPPTWLAALIMNIVSYIFLLVLTLSFGMM
jgi:sterol desaturase/sphingolipid hydroxylase (fatty acid hydroxylase superfamily)